MDPPSGLRSLSGGLAHADDARRVMENKMQEREKELQRLAEEYDRESTRLRCELQKLKAEYNSLAPVARLPSEILDLVFEEYVARHMREYGEVLRPYKWFRILHVCREWRRVAFSAKRLWKCIVPTNSHCVQLALSSSGKLSLTIKFPYHEQQDQAWPGAAHRLIFKELSRVQSAQWRITQSFRRHLAHWATVAHFAAPILKHLSLDIQVHSDTLPGLSTMEMPQLSSLTIVGGTPRILRTLVRPTLTSLYLSRLHVHLHVSEYIAILQKLPLLKHLLIFDEVDVDALGPMDHLGLLPPLATHSTVSLPHLKEIKLGDEGLGIASAQLMKHLAFPITTLVDLMFCEFATAQECSVVLSTIIPKIHASDTALPNGPSSQFRPRSLDLCGLEILLWESVCSWDMDVDLYGDEEPRLSLYQQTHEVFATVSCLFHLVDLTELVTMRIDVTLRAGEWLHLLKDLKVPKLERLCLREIPSNVLLILEALTTRLPPLEAAQDQCAGKPSSAPRYLFPDLKAIHLQHVDFRQKPGRVHADDFIVKAIMLLQRRAEGGCKLDCLSIERPINFSNEEVTLLEESQIAGKIDVLDFGYYVDSSDDGSYSDEDEEEVTDDRAEAVE